MSHESTHPDPLQELWKAQAQIPLEIDMNQIQADAAALDRVLLARDRRERFVAWPLAAIFTAMATWQLVSGNTLSSVGAFIVVGSMFWILFVLRRFGPRSDESAALGLDGQAFLQDYRSELIRQRRLLSLAWLWYCLPILVGIALFNYGIAVAKGQDLGQWALSVPTLITLGVFLAVAALNLVAARGMAQRLVELGALPAKD